MAQDRNGKKVHPGDIVIIRAIVTGVDTHDEFINLAAESIEPTYPGPNKMPFLLNSRQVEVEKSVGDTNPEATVANFLTDSQLAAAKEAIRCSRASYGSVQKVNQ